MFSIQWRYNVQIHVPLALTPILDKLYKFLVLDFTRASVSLSELFDGTTKGSCLVRLLGRSISSRSIDCQEKHTINIPHRRHWSNLRGYRNPPGLRSKWTPLEQGTQASRRNSRSILAMDQRISKLDSTHPQHCHMVNCFWQPKVGDFDYRIIVWSKKNVLTEK